MIERVGVFTLTLSFYGGVMNRLKGMACYLCGPMDRVPDGGVVWREDITPQLKELGVGVLDPCKKPSEYATEDQNTRRA